MRVIIRALAAAAGSVAALAAVQAPVHADTGGNRVYYVEGSKPYTASTARPGEPTRLPVPPVAGARHTYVLRVVPSPGGRHLAEVVQTGGHWHRVFVTDIRGRHAHQAYAVRDPRVVGHQYVWSLDGLSWQGEHRLYFSAQRSDDSAGGVVPDLVSSVRTVHISRSGVAGAGHEVRDTSGLVDPAVDPTGRRLAAIRVDAQECTPGDEDTTTSTIVVLNLVRGTRRDLVTLTSGPSHCPPPVSNLAWSPQGTQLAFTRERSGKPSGLIHNEVDLVDVDGSDGTTPRVAVPDDGRHLVASPTWQAPHRLWFTQEVWRAGHEHARRPNDLYSTLIRAGHGVKRHREAHTAHFNETAPAFG